MLRCAELMVALPFYALLFEIRIMQLNWVCTSSKWSYLPFIIFFFRELKRFSLS